MVPHRRDDRRRWENAGVRYLGFIRTYRDGILPWSTTSSRQQVMGIYAQRSVRASEPYPNGRT